MMGWIPFGCFACFAGSIFGGSGWQPGRLPYNGDSCYRCVMKICALSILFALSLAGLARGQDSSVEKAATSELPSLLAIYKDIHSHPELSGHEQRTSSMVAHEWRSSGPNRPRAEGSARNPERAGRKANPGVSWKTRTAACSLCVASELHTSP